MDAVINYKNAHDDRLRDMGTFKYLLRSLEKNANVFNKIFLTYDGNESLLPSWLDKSKIILVKHEDFIPKEFLPTFNQHIIEMFLHNIPDISPYFVYIKENTFFLDKCSSENFFNNKKIVLNDTGEVDKEDFILYVQQKMCSDLMYYIKKGRGVENIIVPEEGAIPMLLNFNKSVSERFIDLIRTVCHEYEKYSDVTYTIFPIGTILNEKSLSGTKRLSLKLEKYNSNTLEKTLKESDTQILYVDNFGVNNEGLFKNLCDVLNEFLENMFPEPSEYELC